MKIDGSSLVVVSSSQVSRELGGEAVILHLDGGKYYGLNGVGARIWTLLQQPRTLNEIRDILVQEYEVEQQRCEQDLVSLLEELVHRGLIEVREPSP